MTRRLLSPGSVRRGGQVGGSRGGDIVVVGRGHRPGGREDHEATDQVDPDQRTDDDPQGAVGSGGGPRDTGYVVRAAELEDLEPDGGEDDPLEDAPPWRLHSR